MTGQIGREAQIPNPALKPLEKLLGEWRTTGSHPLVPGVVLHGRASFAWQDSGAFLVMRSEIDEPRFPSGIAIFGSDDQLSRYFMLYFDERGVSRMYGVTVDGNVVSWHRDDPDFKQRNVLTVDPSGDRIIGKGEMSRDGSAWEDDLSLTYERMSPSSGPARSA
jgi:hypothetical protein